MGCWRRLVWSLASQLSHKQINQQLSAQHWPFRRHISLSSGKPGRGQWLIDCLATKGDLDDVNVPTAPEAPQLSLCTIVDDVLVLPRDVRTEFLTDPIRSAEWRKLLAEFDRTFAAGEQGSGEVSSAATAPVEAEDAAFKWSDLFPEECKDAIAFHAKYQNNIKGKCAWCPELQVYIVDTSQENIEEHDKKPMLFIEAKETYEIASNEPFLTYGAGTWLMGSKADQWLKDQEGHKHKACLCAFKSDQALVVLEAGTFFEICCYIFHKQVLSSFVFTCRKTVLMDKSKHCGMQFNTWRKMVWSTSTWEVTSSHVLLMWCREILLTGWSDSTWHAPFNAPSVENSDLLQVGGPDKGWFDDALAAKSTADAEPTLHQRSKFLFLFSAGGAEPSEAGSLLELRAVKLLFILLFPFCLVSFPACYASQLVTSGSQRSIASQLAMSVSQTC